MAWKADFQDSLTDAKFNIETNVRDDSFANDHVHPYEPTTYTVLDRLAESGYITEKDHLVDYGSGMGRVPIYLFDKTGCRTTGVEMVKEYYEIALDNLKRYSVLVNEPVRVSFENVCAQDYVFPTTANKMFFFNPFPASILRAVLKKVSESQHEYLRQIHMFFYYPSDGYLAYLSTVDEVKRVDDIDCTDLFKEKDSKNRIMVYETEC